MGKTPKAKMMNILAGHHVPEPRWEPSTAWAPQEPETQRRTKERRAAKREQGSAN